MKAPTKIQIFRLHGTESYSYDWMKRAWKRDWTLAGLARLNADFPMSRSYITGHVKPSKCAAA